VEAVAGEAVAVEHVHPAEHGRLPRRDRFRNEVVIATHFSTRVLAKKIPDMLDGRLKVWL